MEKDSRGQRDYRDLIRPRLDLAGFLDGGSSGSVDSPRKSAKSSGGSGALKSSATITKPRCIPSGRTACDFGGSPLRFMNFFVNLVGA